MINPLKKQLEDFFEQQSEAYFEGRTTDVSDDVEKLIFDLADYIDELETRLAGVHAGTHIIMPVDTPADPAQADHLDRVSKLL